MTLTSQSKRRMFSFTHAHTHTHTHTDPVSIIHQTCAQDDDETTLTLGQTECEMEMGDSRR